MTFDDARVLVTGGAGFVGTALAQRFAGSARSWVVLDSLLPQVHGDRPLTLPDSVEVIVADVRDRQALDRVVAGVQPEIVVHLAAETGTGQSLDEPSRHTDVNVTGTARLLEALSSEGLPRQVVLTSSRAVYGEGAWRAADGTVHYPGARTAAMLASGQWDFPGMSSLPSRADSTAPNPCNIYGATKLAQEHLVGSWGAARGVSCSVLRLQNVYGPGQSPINPYTGITTIFLGKAGSGEALPVYEDGRIIRDFVFIDDVVQAIGAVAAKGADALVDVGSGIPTSIAEMAQVVASLTGAPDPVVTGQYRLGDVRSAAVDMSASRWVRGGADPVPLREGLARLRDWFTEDRAIG